MTESEWGWDWDFKDPGDLGFFDQKEPKPEEAELESDDFHSPAPGEDAGVRDNGDGTASFTGTLIGMGF